MIGLPLPIGGAGGESGCAALLWRKSGVDVTILPVAPIKPDNPWPKRLSDAGCEIEPPFFNGSPPACLKDAIAIDFCCEKACRSWPELTKRGCRLIHVPCHCSVLDHEDATFRHWPPNALVCQSQFQRHVLQLQYSSYGVKEVRTIRGAFDSTLFPYLPCLPYQNSQFIVGAIGRDDIRKWPSRIVRALKIAKESVQKLRGRLLGWTPAMEKASGKLPLWVYNFPPGNMPPDFFLYDCHALLCMSDYCENWPRVVLEAMSSGVPVIADARGGYLEQIIHGETGFLVTDEKHAAIVIQEIASDENLRRRIAENARCSLDKMVDEEAIAAGWSELFASLS